MKNSKVKSTKQALRLKARKDAWATIPASEKIGKSGRYAWTEPGSNKK